MSHQDQPTPEHQRPDGVDDATVEALGKLSEALEVVELDATCVLPYRCEYDFPKMALECAASRDRVLACLGSGLPAYPIGKRVHWLLGDMQGLFHSLEAGEVDLRTALQWCGKMLRSLAQADCHLTYWWKDPLPTGFLYAGLLLSLWTRVRTAVLSWIDG